MIRPSPRTVRLAVCCSLICCLILSGQTLRAASKGDPAKSTASQSESLLPDTTKGYVSISDLTALQDSFNRSQWGQLANEPTLKPFVEDFRRQLKAKGVERMEKLGLSWDELQGVPGGEVSIALVQPAPGRMAIVALVDVTGHKKQAAALLDKISARLDSRGAQRISRDVSESIVLYEMPKQDGEARARQTAFFLQDNLLAASDDLDVLQAIMAARATPRSDSLANLAAYRQIMDRCAQAAGPNGPHLRWFVEPFGYVEMIRSVATQPRRKGIDLYKALKNQGFTAVQGIGGYVNFSAENCELVHRTMIYAPPVKGHENSEEKYELAARMLKFPTISDLEPQVWVPRHVATYNSFNLDIQSAFAASETLVDEVMAEKGIFRDIMDSLKNDPQGPKVDIEKELVGNLGSRITVITDYELPIGPKSERLVVGIEAKNEKPLADAIRRLMEGDCRRREIDGFVVWEKVEEETAVPDFKIEDPSAVKHANSADDNANGGQKGDPQPPHVLPNAAMTVAYGHLFVASHIDFLKQVLRQARETDGLAQSADYRFVSNRMRQLGANQISFRLFSRTAEEYRPTYELIRTGQMPKAETLLGQLLNAMLGEGKDGVPRKQKIDGRLLPEFDKISHYFGPAGTCVTSEPNGWLIVGCTLNGALVTGGGLPPIVARQPAVERVPVVPVRDPVRKDPSKGSDEKASPTKPVAKTAPQQPTPAVVPVAVPVGSSGVAPSPTPTPATGVAPDDTSDDDDVPTTATIKVLPATK